MAQRWLRRGSAALVAMAFLATTAWAVKGWRDQADLERARREMAAGRYAEALPRLARLAGNGPNQPEVSFLLGACEYAADRPDAAVAAWARVPARTAFFARAALGRAQVLLDRGRFVAAEEVLEAVAALPGREGDEPRLEYQRLLRYEGRIAEVRAMFQRRWRQSPDPADALRQHALLDLELYQAELIRAVLEAAAAAAPDDDRVRLGRANLAIRTGRMDEARTLLEGCLRLRPDDLAVWRAMLDLALAVRDPTEARRCLGHLPADTSTPAEPFALRAWFAAIRGDARGERLALERLVEREPGRPQALERLVELAILDGQAERAALLRRRKADVDRDLSRYRELMFGKDLAYAIPELARLAEALGRRFEARGWATLLERQPAGRREAAELIARLDETEPPALPLGLTYSQVVGDLGPVPEPELARPSASTPSPRPAPVFADDAEAAGLRFTFDNGRSPLRQLPETNSGGVGLLDYDGDGWLDVYLVQGGPFPPDPARPHSGDRLFRNKGDGSFEDVTAEAGIAGLPQGYGHGVAVGDFDDDGHPDLFITRWRSYSLYRNQGDGSFRDVTEAVGLGGGRDWPTSAAFADLDGDGDLDLYVCHYLDWDERNAPACRHPQTRELTYCGPLGFTALPDHLFRNEGGRFLDVTAEAGIVDTDGRGMGVVAADLDGDDRVDLYVANDASANLLFRNLGGFRFEEAGLASGVAASAEGGYKAGMGVACGDLDADGRPDLFVTNLNGESTTFFRNGGQGLFFDRTAASGLGIASRHLLGFGIGLADVDNDGRLDLMTANGHVNDLRPNFPYAMPAQLLLGADGGRLVDATDRAGPPWRVPRVGRGLAVGDLDNDGRIDAVLLAQNEPLAYLHNRSRGGHFVTFRLEGAGSNRDGVGARVTLVSGGHRRVVQRVGGGSYQSACDPRLHFGLGDRAWVEEVEVRWPSGRVDRHLGLPADAGYLLREGIPAPGPLPGFARPTSGSSLSGNPVRLPGRGCPPPRIVTGVGGPSPTGLMGPSMSLFESTSLRIQPGCILGPSRYLKRHDDSRRAVRPRRAGPRPPRAGRTRGRQPGPRKPRGKAPRPHSVSEAPSGRCSGRARRVGGGPRARSRPASAGNETTATP